MSRIETRRGKKTASLDPAVYNFQILSADFAACHRERQTMTRIRGSASVLLGTTLLALASTAAGETPTPPEHPLVPVLSMAGDSYRRIEREIGDYTCNLTKRERINGRLADVESMFVKVRHERIEDARVVTPFSVYVRFLGPERVKGREVLFVHGANHGKLIVRNGGVKFGYITTAVLPDSPVAMQEGRYPLTEIGVKNLTRRLIENGQTELKSRQCAVKTLPGAKINNRPCTLILVSSSVRQGALPYQYAHIFVDDQMQIPVRYAAYDWPEKAGGPARLLEEYTYTDVRLNVGLTDWDFDHRNEEYQFLKSFEP